MAVTVHPALHHCTRTKDRPTVAPKGDMYLYLALGAERAKIGISTNLRSRLMYLSCRAKFQIEETYFVQLPAGEARRREAIIKNALGERMGDVSRYSEWFPRARHTLALSLMCVPDLALAIQASSISGGKVLRDLPLADVRPQSDGTTWLKNYWGTHIIGLDGVWRQLSINKRAA